MLGICYGAEILALTLGGTIRKSPSIQKGYEEINVFGTNLISKKPLNVFESHEFEISKLPGVLVQLADSKNCKYEIIQYEKKLIFGTQFHPEMSSDGHDLIEKFCLL
ncbi:MAG: type 1 glutamine amidotransferase [Nitrosopumilus sp.]